MAKQPLTPQQKADKKIRDQLIVAHNQVLSAWNFGEIKTWEGVYSKLGYSFDYINQHPELLKGPAQYPEVKAFLQKQKDQLEKDLVAAREPANVSQPTSQPADVVTKTLDVVEQEEFKKEVEAQAQAPKNEPPSSSNNYGLIPSPNESCNLFWFQKKAIAEAWDILITKNLRSCLILSGTGTGKTWMDGGVLRRFMDAGYHEDKTMSHIPYLFVTKSSIVTQMERVMERDFNLTVEDLSVINIESLRANVGKFWLKRSIQVVAGEEEEVWKWKPHVQPAVVIWSECQGLKNPGSLQHKIACAMNDMGGMQPKQVFESATPFTKVSEAKCFAVSTHKSLEYILGKRSGFPPGATLTNETWPAYSKAIAYPGSPDEYNEAAVERLMQDLDEYVVRVKGVRPQFEADNHVQMIDFQSEEEHNYYHKAWERYLEQKRKLEAEMLGGVATGMALLVQFLKFRMAAEYCRRRVLVERMLKAVNEGNAAVCAVSFKNTIVACVQLLVEEYGVPRSKISLIWGGGQTQLTDKQKAKAKIKSLADEQLDAQGVTREELLENLDLEDVEDRELVEIPEHLKLGMQTPEDRQREIDKFQRGDSLFCFYTLKAGGVGLSLHHTDEMTNDWNRSHPDFPAWYEMIQKLPEKQRPKPGKCRRKESGYVVEEDIKFIPTRPRVVDVTPTWSPIELVQGVGRAPRLTSLSVTKQFLLFYKGTIEGRVADIAGKGLRCLSKIVKHREPWSDLVVNGGERLEEYKNTLPDDNGDSTGLVEEENEE